MHYIVPSTDVYIYILLDTALATDVNKYSLAFASCQPIWRTLVGRDAHGYPDSG